MRALVLLLVFANIVVLALTSSFFGSAEGPVEDGRTHAPLSPDRIHIVSKGEPPVATSPVVVSPVVATVVAPVAPKLGCLIWQELNSVDADKLAAAVAADSVLALQREDVSVKKLSYWVHIPPSSGGKSAARKVRTELEQLGFSDHSLMKVPGTEQWAVSIGLFTSEELATKSLARLHKKGVRAARMKVREQIQQKPLWRVQGPVDKLERLPPLLAGRSPDICPDKAVDEAAAKAAEKPAGPAAGAAAAPAVPPVPAPASASASPALVPPPATSPDRRP